jgi:hypothetical protein
MHLIFSGFLRVLWQHPFNATDSGKKALAGENLSDCIFFTL